MHYPVHPLLDPRTRATLAAELAQAAQNPKLCPLMERAPDLWPGLVRSYLQLARLPRKLRRQLQRRWKRSLAALALLLALGQAPALATDFGIPCPGGVGDNAALIQAIIAANDEVANLGPDSINLADNCTHTLTEPISSSLGNNGLPVISFHHHH